MHGSRPILQINHRPGIIDLGWGHPDPVLLPAAEIREAAGQALHRFGTDALQYGHPRGPGPLLDWLIDRITRQEGRGLKTDEIMITGGNSSALDLVLTSCIEPDAIVVVESPTYHLALRILRDHPIHLVPAPTDNKGLLVDALADILERLKQTGKRAQALYTISTHSNPTGISLSGPRRRALVELAAAEDLLVIEDDVYRELTYDGPAPPSLWSIDPSGSVIRIGSFSKSLAPGLRLGWLTASQRVVSKIVNCGVLDSGGGINHFTALTVAMFCEMGAFDRTVVQLRETYQARRDALLLGLRQHVSDHAMMTTPQGGFFLWVTLPDHLSSQELLHLAEQAGVSYVPGSNFDLDGENHPSLRLAFSYYEPKVLIEATERLGYAIRSLD